MEMDEPVIGKQPRIRVVEAEVVIADANGAICGHGGGGQERLPIGRREVERSLIDANRLRPSESAVVRHTESDVVVLKVAEASILPDGVESALDLVYRASGIDGITDEMPR